MKKDKGVLERTKVQFSRSSCHVRSLALCLFRKRSCELRDILNAELLVLRIQRSRCVGSANFAWS